MTASKPENDGVFGVRRAWLIITIFAVMLPAQSYAADQQAPVTSEQTDSTGDETLVEVQSDEGSDVVRNQYLMHSGRHGVTPFLGASLNHPYLHQAVLGLRYDYFLNNWSSIGVDTGYTLSTENAMAQNIADLRSDFQTTTFGFHAMGSAMLIPFQGKFLWKGPPSIRYDVFFRFAGGLVELKGTDDKIPSETTIAPKFGAGAHIYLGQQASLVFEVSDTLVSMHPSTTRDGAVLAKSLHNVFTLNLGVVFHFPENSKVGR